MVRQTSYIRDPVSTTSSVRSILATPSPQLYVDLRKRDTICGNLNNQYPNAEAPVCAGASSICTFANERQGCCDNQGSCHYYTTCVGFLSNEKCEGDGCLSCSQAGAPYCTKYAFSSAGYGNFDGFSCGPYDLGSQIIFGSAGAAGTITSDATTLVSTTISLASSSSSTSRSSSSLSSSLTSRTLLTTTSGLSSTSGTATSSSASATSPTTTTTANTATSKGLIAGGVVGGLAGVVVIAGVALWWMKKRSERIRLETQGNFIQPNAPSSWRPQMAHYDDPYGPR